MTEESGSLNFGISRQRIIGISNIPAFRSFKKSVYRDIPGLALGRANHQSTNWYIAWIGSRHYQ